MGAVWNASLLKINVAWEATLKDWPNTQAQHICHRWNQDISRCVAKVHKGTVTTKFCHMSCLCCLYCISKFLLNSPQSRGGMGGKTILGKGPTPTHPGHIPTKEGGRKRQPTQHLMQLGWALPTALLDLGVANCMLPRLCMTLLLWAGVEIPPWL